MKILLNLVRLLVALVFLFSGVVKLFDPMGMTLKLQAYLSVLGFATEPGSIFVVTAAIILGTFETAIGMHLLWGIRRKLTTRLLVMFMTLLTLVTLYIYIADPISDCGCFGDAVKLTNGQTLSKNLILWPMTIWLMVKSWDIVPFIKHSWAWFVSLSTHVACLALGFYAWYDLPIMDFTPYKEGVHLRTAIVSEIPDFALFDDEGNDMTDSILLVSEKTPTMLLAIPFEKFANSGCHDQLNDLYDYCQEKGWKFYGVSAESDVEIEDWRDRTGATYPFVYSSSETLEAMVRSNPGLVLLKEGRVAGKWSYHKMLKVKDLH